MSPMFSIAGQPMIMLKIQEYSTTSENTFMSALDRANVVVVFGRCLVNLNVLNADHARSGDVGARKKNNKDIRGVPSW